MIEGVTIVDAVNLRKLMAQASFTERVLLYIADEMKPMGDTDPYIKTTSVTLEKTARLQMKARAELLKESE